MLYVPAGHGAGVDVPFRQKYPVGQMLPPVIHEEFVSFIGFGVLAPIVQKYPAAQGAVGLVSP